MALWVRLWATAGRELAAEVEPAAMAEATLRAAAAAAEATLRAAGAAAEARARKLEKQLRHSVHRIKVLEQTAAQADQRAHAKAEAATAARAARRLARCRMQRWAVSSGATLRTPHCCCSPQSDLY
jgi:hypothetical protein